jgi:hypothetical protein
MAPTDLLGLHSRQAKGGVCSLSILVKSFLRLMNPGHIPVRRHGLSHVETYEVTADELDRIESEGADVGFNFHIGLACLTTATSFLVVLFTSPPPDNQPKTFIVFVVIIVVGFLAGIIFAIKWFLARGAFAAVIRRIRERQVGPLGEKGQELKLEQLEDLPSEKAEGAQ